MPSPRGFALDHDSPHGALVFSGGYCRKAMFQAIISVYAMTLCGRVENTIPAKGRNWRGDFLCLSTVNFSISRSKTIRTEAYLFASPRDGLTAGA